MACLTYLLDHRRRVASWNAPKSVLAFKEAIYFLYIVINMKISSLQNPAGFSVKLSSDTRRWNFQAPDPQMSGSYLILHIEAETNRRNFADDIFKSIFLKENARISLKISLKFVPEVRINNIPALVQIMAWGRPGDKPLSEPMMVSLLTHICVTRPQWVKDTAPE